MTRISFNAALLLCETQGTPQRPAVIDYIEQP